MMKLTKPAGNGNISAIGWGDCPKMGIMGNEVVGLGMLAATLKNYNATIKR